MDQDAIRSQLVSFVCDTFFVEEDEIDLDNSLVDDGIIDSFGLVEISAFLERAFSVHVDEAEMNRTNFGSINRLTSFIQRKITTG